MAATCVLAGSVSDTRGGFSPMGPFVVPGCPGTSDMQSLLPNCGGITEAGSPLAASAAAICSSEYFDRFIDPSPWLGPPKAILLYFATAVLFGGKVTVRFERDCERTRYRRHRTPS